MKTSSRIIVAALAAALAIPLTAEAAKGERRNKKNESALPAFDTVDASKDGTVSKEEFVAAVKDKIGGEDAAKTRFGALDKDSNGKLSKEEYAAASTETKKRRKKDKN